MRPPMEPSGCTPPQVDATGPLQHAQSPQRIRLALEGGGHQRCGPEGTEALQRCMANISLGGLGVGI